MSLLELHQVSYRYGRSPVLRDFDMTLDVGDRCLMLGPSGSGKSTLINLVCGFLKPDSGTIDIAGQRISEGSEAARDAVRRRHISVVFQSLRLVSALDIKANLSLAARLARREVTPRDIHALLEEMGIAGKAHAKPYMLSQGEAQRAALARALVVKPDLLIADEPTSALDARNAETVARLLLDLSHTHGTTLLVATHDERLRSHFSQVIDLHAGVVEQIV
ncbi:ABC transporter ATP-binding protein [Altericroceibacterium endophyticum]|nr:ATP-binding cassette domain-containing protein [Altericroceibacterium endophyticum]